MIKRVGWLLVTGLTIASSALARPSYEPDDLPPPRPEVEPHPDSVALPPMPTFGLPISEPGVHGPRELQVRGKPLLGTEIKVKGYVTWVFDCVAALAQASPTATHAQVLEAIDKEPALCPQPRFDLGDTRAATRDASIWVVEVPRRIPPSDAGPSGWTPLPKLAAGFASNVTVTDRSSDRPRHKVEPSPLELAVGDLVVVSGLWTTRSPHAGHNTGGLLVFRSVARVAPAAATAASAEPRVVPETALTVATRPRLRPWVSTAVRNASVDHLNACVRANAAQLYADGIAHCQAAIEAWAGNHLAWYTLASAHIARAEWAEAAAAAAQAVAQRPDQAMYQLYYGISLYNAGARHDPASAAPPAKLDDARDALRRAVILMPTLWRAHFYLGRVYRDLGDDARAAEQLDLAIRASPHYGPAYVALAELYRGWNHIEPALAVATLGLANAPAADRGDLWVEIGMADVAKHATDPALEAFGKALAAVPDHMTAKFQRGQLYFHNHDYASAKRDLDDVMRSSDPGLAATKPAAAHMLREIDHATPH